MGEREAKLAKDRVSLKRMTRQIQTTVKKLDESSKKSSSRSRCDLMDELQRFVDLSRINEAILERLQGHWEEQQNRGSTGRLVTAEGQEPLRRRTWPEEG